MKSYKITVTLQVDQVWIEDGFDPTGENRVDEIREFFEAQMLPYANAGVEMIAKVEVESLEK